MTRKETAVKIVFAKIASAEMRTKISEQNATVIESRNQASVGLTLLKSTSSCLRSRLTVDSADA